MKILALASILLFSVPSLYGDVYRDAGAGAFSFLKIDPGARAAALGGTALLNSGETGVFTNPALLPDLDGASMTAGHNQWYGDAVQNFLAWNFPLGSFDCSLGARYVHVGDLEMREGATSDPLTTFSAWDLSIHGAAGVRLGMFDLGVGLKYLREKVWTESATGFAADLGVAVRPAEDLCIAAALQHMGPPVTMAVEDYRLPATWRAGARYGFPTSLGRVSISAEAGKPLDNRPFAGTGIEYEPSEWLALRFGSRFGNETGDLTFGTGLTAGGWGLDYAFVPSDHALGTVHRFTLGRSL
ncbi:MAG: hypothetical protein AVO35_04100 [Candidatus Aegiribacteria sp. MLS_C]|nr:MAG: hypothetical protein AVO35_04100 [Candidatus Aegiribacteria sp. MLS_C]